MAAIPLSAVSTSEPAVPPSVDSERDALKTDIGLLVPSLQKVDSGQQLGALLKIVSRARALGAEGSGVLKDFASQLRQNRAFDDLYILTSEMRARGMADLDAQRWEIQALIELAVYETALDLARPLMATGPKTAAGQDGYSALGRIYKQMYMDAAAGRSKEEPETLALYLQRSFSAYMHVWQAEKSESTAYYGVNAVAIAYRAIADKITPDDPGAKALAEEVLAVLGKVAKPTVWTHSSRGEALIALGRFDEATRSYGQFAFSPDVSLFQLGASLRQIEEVWQLKGEDPAKGGPVRLLKAALLAKLGGMPAGGSPGNQTAQVNVTAKEAELMRQQFSDKPQTAPARGGMQGLQQLFGDDPPTSLSVVRNTMARALAVCRIHCTIGGKSKGFASGFAVKGSVLYPPWGDDPVIVTNNHVISSTPNASSQRVEYCEAAFVSPETEEEHRVKFGTVLWESEVEAHDITIVRPAGPLPPHVKPLANLPSTTLPGRAPDDQGIGRVYVIGFPAAGELSFSFADNIFLDHDAPEGCEVQKTADGVMRIAGVTPEPVRLHYKTPTLGGSSGSPVFDANEFGLLGVHHRGLPDIPRLRGRQGAYAANEGIWIESIRSAIAETETQASGPESAPVKPRQWRSIAAAVTAGIVAAPTAAIATAIEIASGAGAAIGARSRVIAGFAGATETGESPVAAQVIKVGKATPADIKAVGMESVIGLDDRTRIFDTNMAPWRAICAIRSYWGTQLAVGTGVLIGPNIVLTAGHVVFPRDKRVAPTEIEVIPGLNGAQAPYGRFKASKIWIHPSWQSNFDIQNDVAAIHFDQPIGQKIGWFALASRTPDDLRYTWAHVTGYPGEKMEKPPAAAGGRETAPIQASQLWHHAAPVLNVQNDRVFYAADTTPGQSGAPIYIKDPDAPETPTVIGVHAYGRASTPVAVGNANSGAWITPALFDMISAWCEESNRLPDAKA